jgi:transposase
LLPPTRSAHDVRTVPKRDQRLARAPKTSRTETSVAQRAHVWTRYLEGHLYASILRAEGVPYSIVQDISQKRLDSGDSTFKSKARSGRPKKTSIRDKRALVHYALEHPQDTLNVLAMLSKST